MNLFFEESGDFKAGAVLAQQGEAFQVELQSGKRTKVRARDVLLQFSAPAPSELIAEAQTIAGDIDLDFLWEVAGQEEFGFAELGAEYFGHEPKPHEAAGLLLRLHSALFFFICIAKEKGATRRRRKQLSKLRCQGRKRKGSRRWCRRNT